ncbi:hypothetical protein RB3152 [Rhodopirellula baltica SH 1]|uniref:Uncharacterized protein n=1 Tax=Rhodopirellula baltica (strain DSM 10527 / NCIMB 13988 / SH1) TaxID=243090 RepID=Q7UUQ1_RHOBA|nr:hypothetical protein RB3152 [Rhodopirellula baltica SH 1]
MLAVRRKPPGEEPEGSRPSATSLVVHVVPSKASQHLLLLPIKHKILPKRSNATRGNASTSATKTVSRA